MQALMTSRTKGNVEEADTCARGVHSMASCTNFADEVAGSGRHYSLQQSPQKLTEKDNPHFIPGNALHSITLTGSDCTAHRTEIISSECFITLSDYLKLHPQSHLPLSLLLSLSPLLLDKFIKLEKTNQCLKMLRKSFIMNGE